MVLILQALLIVVGKMLLITIIHKVVRIILMILGYNSQIIVDRGFSNQSTLIGIAHSKIIFKNKIKVVSIKGNQGAEVERSRGLMNRVWLIY